MAKMLALVLLLVIFSGCAGASRITKKGNNTFELVMEDDGTMSMLNTSRLEEEWNKEALEICPNGYTVRKQTFFPEKAFESARLSGTIICK